MLLEDRRRRLRELKEQSSVVVVVERDVGQTIANAQCLLPARLHKIRHAQLVWRHDNIFLTKRIRSECVLISTTTCDDPDTSACMVGQNVHLPTEPAKQTLSHTDNFRRC